MTYEVYINDSLIEIRNPKTIGLTFQVASIFDPESRSGNLTNSFIAPFTLVNNIVLGNLLNINSDSNLPYQRNTAKIVQNGIEIVPNGFALISEASDGYRITIYSGNVTFFDLIKDLNVNDLDFSSLNHVYNAYASYYSWQNDIDYIYPIIEWGEKLTPLLTNSPILHTEDLIPVLKLRTIFNKLFDYINYTLKGTFKDSNEFDTMIVTPQNFGLSNDEADDLDGYGRAFIAPTSNFDTGLQTDGTETEVLISFNDFSQTNFSGQNYTPTNDVWGRLHFYASPLIFIYNQGTDITDDYQQRIQILEDGVEIATASTSRIIADATYGEIVTIEVYTPYMHLKSTSVYSFKLFVKVNRYYLGAPFVVDYRVTNEFGITTLSSDIGPAGTDVWHFKSFFEVQVRRTFSTGNTIPMTLLYDLKCNDVVKDIANMYNLIIQTNEVTKEVFISPLNDLTTNIPNAINWSIKVDLSKKITVKYNIGSYAQANELKYTDIDNVPNGIGAGNLSVLNENLPIKKPLVTISSAGAESVKSINDYPIPIIPTKTTRIEAFKNVKHRYFMIDKVTQSVTFNYAFDESTEVSYTTDNFPLAYFSKTGKADSLDFTNLIAANYGTLQGMLNKIKFVSAYFQLKETDVVDIDFTIPRYLDISDGKVVVNGYFYINKISNFKVDSSTLVELIRL